MDGDDQEREQAWQQWLRSWWDPADQAYHERRLQDARELYDGVLAAMATHGTPALVALARYALGNVQMQLGHLTAALDTLVPEVKEQNAPQLQFEILTLYLQIAQQLPLPPTAVERAFAAAEPLAQGSPARIGELLVHRARWLAYRGDLEAATPLATRALAAKRTEPTYGQVFDFHFYGLCALALRTRDLAKAQDWLSQWDAAPDQMPSNRRLRQGHVRAALAERTGDLTAARGHAATAFEAAADSDYEEVLGPLAITALQIELRDDDPERIATARARVLRHRGTERGLLRLAVRRALPHGLRGCRRLVATLQQRLGDRGLDVLPAVWL